MLDVHSEQQSDWMERSCKTKLICPSLWFPVSFPVFFRSAICFQTRTAVQMLASLWENIWRRFHRSLVNVWEFVGRFGRVRGNLRGILCTQKKVGGLEPWNFMTFHLLGIIIPTDKLIFFRGVETTNQLMIIIVLICIDHDHHDHIFINLPFEFSPLRTNQVGLFQWPQVKPKRRCFPWAF